MNSLHTVTRRAMMGTLAAVPFAMSAAGSKHIPIGLELYSVRDELKKDPAATLQGVAKAGYECVEFYAPYYDWTPDHAHEVRKQLDSLGISCYSTHNERKNLEPAGLAKAIELNKILGSRYIVMSSAGHVETVDDWKQVAAVLDSANKKLAKSKMHSGYHNHEAEWQLVDGKRPMDILAADTDKSVMLQLDVGTCVASGNDPVKWIDQNPGRIKSVHLKDWSPQKQYRVLFGEGTAPWKQIFAAAESVGGVEFYLMEQEGSDYPEMETAERCLVAYKDIHG